MARALRLEYSGALYHVTSRGDRREDIYEDDIDRATLMVEKVGDWSWSSYLSVIKTADAINCFNRDWILSCFGSNERKSIKLYIDFVLEGMNMKSPLIHVKNQIFLGSETFVENGLKLIDVHKDFAEVPRIQRRVPRKPLASYAELTSSRNEAIIKAYKSGGYTLKEVGEFFGLGCSMVSRIVSNSKFKT